MDSNLAGMNIQYLLSVNTKECYSYEDDNYENRFGSFPLGLTLKKVAMTKKVPSTLEYQMYYGEPSLLKINVSTIQYRHVFLCFFERIIL